MLKIENISSTILGIKYIIKSSNYGTILPQLTPPAIPTFAVDFTVISAYIPINITTTAMPTMTTTTITIVLVPSVSKIKETFI